MPAAATGGGDVAPRMATAESLALGYGKAYGTLVYALSASSLAIATPVIPDSAGHPTIRPSASPRSSLA